MAPFRCHCCALEIILAALWLSFVLKTDRHQRCPRAPQGAHPRNKLTYSVTLFMSCQAALWPDRPELPLVPFGVTFGDFGVTFGTQKAHFGSPRRRFWSLFRDPKSNETAHGTPRCQKMHHPGNKVINLETMWA